MAPALSVWKQTAGGDLGASRVNVKPRAGSKWLESIQAELDEIDIVLGKDVKAATNGGLQSTHNACGPATVSSVYRRNGKRSPSPKVRRLAKNSGFRKDPDVVSQSQSPGRHLSVQRDLLGSQNTKPNHSNPGRGDLIRQALAISDSRRHETNQSNNMTFKTNASRSSSLRRSGRSDKNIQMALFEEHTSEAENAFRELVEIKKKFKQTLLGHLRDSSWEPSGRYPSSLSPKRGRCLGWLGVAESSTQWKGANWGCLTESQRPAPSPHSVAQSVVPLYPTQDAWNSTRARSASSVWSREQTLRTGPEQWREGTLHGVAWRHDGRKRSNCRTRSTSRSQSRSKSPGARKDHMCREVGSDMNVVGPTAWKQFEGGCFNRSPRRTSDWIYEGVDKQFAIMQHSEGRLSARRQEAQQSLIPKNSNRFQEPPAGVQVIPFAYRQENRDGKTQSKKHE